MNDGGVVKNIHYGDIHTKLPLHIDMRATELPSIIDNTALHDPDYLKAGDLVIADASEDYDDIGKTVEIINANDEIILAGLHTIPLRPKGDIALGFGSYLTSTTLVHNQIRKMANGISVYGISKSNLAKVKINIPSLAEQKKIARFLSLIDELAATQARRVELLTRYKTGVAAKIFSRAVRFRDSLDVDSTDWDETTLGNLFDISSSKRVYESDWRDSGVPFYRTREILSLINHESISEPIFIDKSLYDKYTSKYGATKAGDILVTGVGTIGKAYLVENDDEFYFKDGNVICLKDIGRCNSKFVYHCFHTRQIQKQINDNASITTVGTYTIIDAKKTKINLPSLSEQKVIADFLFDIDLKISTESDKIAAIKGLKKSLLQRMFV
jgi:type I restriction enzyme S subunit